MVKGGEPCELQTIWNGGNHKYQSVWLFERLFKSNNEPSSSLASLDLAPSDNFAGIRVCLEFIPSWSDIFFPLTFCSWGGPKEEAEERSFTKYVLSPACMFYFHRKRRQTQAKGSWPMRMWPQQAASGNGGIDRSPWFSRKGIVGAPRVEICALLQDKVWQFFFMCYPAISEELSLCWSPVLESSWVGFKTTVCPFN